ncbi:MAG TPA: DNA mismatch repair protein MutS [Phycisphaerales bacterium]|nr:DNA mismatch repair protein MutS [Phycisphaerales bacterium]HRQ76058.1 DNA mismatch repair protein MutS [Phycisphaerales bacterium]
MTVAPSSRTPRDSVSDPRETPAMRQYRRFKEQHPECILLFRMGDFYELFNEDAVVVAKALNLTLTQRTAGVPMAGVPYHAIDTYLRRMIEHGFRVAVCDQIQDPKEAKGIVDRAVTRVITPGTLVDEHLLDESSANLIGAIQFLETGDESAAVLALAELSTGAFTLFDLPAGHVTDELARLRPTELAYVETADGSIPRRVELIREVVGCALTPRAGWTYRAAEAREQLCAHFGVSTLAGFGLEDDDTAIGPAGALLRYLEETQPGDPAVRQAGGLSHLRPPKREAPDQYVTIDAASLRSLEIERTMRSGQTEGSLLATLQRCRTAMGKRLLRTWLCFPLRDGDRIRTRQIAVGSLIEDRQLAEQLETQVDGVQDVARIAGRIAMNRATPRDLVALGRSTSRLSAIASLIEGVPALMPHHERLAALAESLAPLARTIEETCVDEPPAHLREGGLFRDGMDAELDEARGLQRDANTWLAAYQKRLIEQTDIQSLKVGYNKVFGYYIEITHANTKKVPDAFSRKQTLRNAERYITPELKEFEDKVMTAEARAFERERVLFERLCAQAAALAGGLAQYAETVAELDVLLNFAEIAVRFGYVKPDIVEEPTLDIEQGRHPVLDRTLGERFVPNDCTLGKTSLALITGPNMAGKSTYIRQVALITLLAHTGSYVPASRAAIGLVDRIFTRIGASDELHAGHSTFMVEMTETANILHHVTRHSLVILDEIGRGTSTLDGLSLAWAIAESLAASKPRTLFATHYHELTSLAERLENVTNLHVSVREWGDEIVFLHRILPGKTDRSYGIHVAKIAGLPAATIARAQELLESLTVHSEEVSRETPMIAASAGAKPHATSGQLSLFTEYVPHPVVEELKKLDLNTMTPMQAFDALRTLREKVEHP